MSAWFPLSSACHLCNSLYWAYSLFSPIISIARCDLCSLLLDLDGQIWKHLNIHSILYQDIITVMIIIIININDNNDNNDNNNNDDDDDDDDDIIQ